MTINTVTLVGNLTKDPEKGKAGETPFITFSLAVNEWRNKQEYANFFDCVLYGDRAKSLFTFLKKGMKVTISGRLRQDRWETDGQKRSKVIINVFEVELPPKATDNEKNDIPW